MKQKMVKIRIKQVKTKQSDPYDVVLFEVVSRSSEVIPEASSDSRGGLLPTDTAARTLKTLFDEGFELIAVSINSQTGGTLYTLIRPRNQSSSKNKLGKNKKTARKPLVFKSAAKK